MASEIGMIGSHDETQSEMMGEMCLVVDIDDNVIGAESKLVCHKEDGVRHRAFSVLIFDSKGRLLVQKRSAQKITFPGVWANSCCSHPLDVESENDGSYGVQNAARRKLDQELGIPMGVTESWAFHHIGRMEYSCRWNKDWIEREIDHIMVVNADTEVEHNENEISDVEWVDSLEITRMMEGKGHWREEVIAPWFRLIWENFAIPHYCDPSTMAISINEDIIYCGEVNMDGDEVNPGQTLLNALADHRKRVEDEIMESLGKMEQKNLHGAMTHLFKGGGKRLRAILPRLVGEAVNGANEGHYTLGASIEIIHNFTLIHDDIIDQDPIRRGLDAVHVEYDDATAINAGDAMLAVGFEILAESEDIPDSQLGHLIRSIGEMVRKVAEGQQEDIEFETRGEVSEQDYIEMIAGKTSAMFETCARTGAILADADEETVENMAEWGLNLGLCFQLMDDLIDITGDTETLGKPAGSDIVQGKMTLIAIHAKNSESNLANFESVFGSGECDAETLALAVSELGVSGSIDYARNRAMHHHSKAHACLEKLPKSQAVEILKELTDFQLIRIS
ncbi:MAG: isopentenyl-diphosphate delta-isomerase [Candidatus Thermoplasmatota archaeon]|nr:isopentenyl-diphosphate delta-isomerase [Candidatus Thermoplasmatota archaeon]